MDDFIWAVKGIGFVLYEVFVAVPSQAISSWWGRLFGDGL